MRSLQRLLRGEAPLRIRAAANPIITSTPAITSARFTGRDYSRILFSKICTATNRI